ncbi:VOC family protein [Litoribacter populi]|uniref:VOC family protein n=1 Tax=Litoribacter populi TaxID=2598460 RepID=UPI00163DB4F4|nr:VOC family protein [Litoribacter populi]
MTKKITLVLILTLLTWFMGICQSKDTRLDHVPIAVMDIIEAEKTFLNLGFSIKNGKMHSNGLINFFLKFADGTYIEIISPSKGVQDSTTEFYADFLKKSEGGAALCLSADFEDNATSYKNWPLKQFDFPKVFTITQIDSSEFDWLFFIKYHADVIDEPRLLIHDNQVLGIEKVHLSQQKFDQFQKLFGPQKNIGSDVNAKTHITGITFKVQDLISCKKVLVNRLNIRLKIQEKGGRKSILLPKEYAHDVWFEFVQ